jgi:hypothetical protein
MQDEWEKVQTSPAWDFKKEDTFIGYYNGVQVNVGQNKSKLYNFTTEDGKMIDIWGSTVLDIRLKTCVPGEKIKIVYHGIETNPQTKREYHNFEVFKSKTNKAEIKDEDIPVINEEDID